MKPLELTFACGKYDRMEAMRTGEVTPEGINLNFLPIDAPREIFDRMVGNLEFDVAELSISEFITMTSRGECPFVALPVFPSRVFRHSFIFINAQKGISEPKSLEHKRVGVGLYTQTAAVWIRGHLSHDYQVNLSTIRWVQGAVEKAGAHGSPSAAPPLVAPNLENNMTDKSLSDLLASGEIDALIGARIPNSFRKHPDVVRLFPDYRSTERKYFHSTAIYPIMHLIAIRRDVYERNRWIGSSLYKAFVQAKGIALSEMRFSAAPK